MTGTEPQPDTVRPDPDPTPTRAPIAAAQCADMSEVRREIDAIDRRIIGMLGDRLTYVQRAADFKTSPESVRALDRVASMLEDRERWAAETGLRPEPIRQLFADLVDYFTDHELREWSNR